MSRENLERIIKDESFEAPRTGALASLGVKRAAHRGFREGQYSLDFMAFAESLGVEVKDSPANTTLIPGTVLSERKPGPFDHLGLPPELERLLSGFYTADHQDQAIPNWLAFHTANITMANPNKALDLIWEEIGTRLDTSEDAPHMPVALSTYEVACYLGVVSGANHLTRQFVACEPVITEYFPSQPLKDPQTEAIA